MATKKQVGVAYGIQKKKVKQLEEYIKKLEIERDLFRSQYIKSQLEK